MTQKAKDQPESVRWNKTLIADILHALKAGPFDYSPVPELTFDPLTPTTYNLTHRPWQTPISWVS